MVWQAYPWSHLILFRAPVVLGIPSTGVKGIYEQDLPPVNFAGWQVTVVALTFPPGADSPKHVHPGFVLGYVLDGNFRFHLDGERERVLSTGSLFYEAPGAIHLSSGSGSATEPARVLALAFGEKGKATTRLYDWQTCIANRRSPEAWTGYPYSQGNEE